MEKAKCDFYIEMMNGFFLSEFNSEIGLTFTFKLFDFIRS